MRCQLNGCVEQRLIIDNAPRLDTARGSEDELGCRIINTRRQLGRRKATKNDAMHRTQPCTGQSRNRRLGNHRHINNDAVAFRNAMRLHHTGHGLDAVEQVAIAQRGAAIAQRAVMDKSSAPPMARRDMAIDTVKTAIHLAIQEPAIAGFIAREGLCRWACPIKAGGLALPEGLGGALPVLVNRLI